MGNAININVPEERPMSCMAACTFRLVLVFYDDAAKTVPSDLNGTAFRMQVKDGSENVIIEFSTADGEGLTIENDNELHFEKSEADMDVEPGQYKYDLLQLTYDDDTLPHLFGAFTIRKTQSRFA